MIAAIGKYVRSLSCGVLCIVLDGDNQGDGGAAQPSGAGMYCQPAYGIQTAGCNALEDCYPNSFIVFELS